jgi:L-threonylcarbamoyladenylate synthase
MNAHYAPKTRLVLSDTPEKTRSDLQLTGKKVAVLSHTELNDYARNLYAELHRLDSLNFDVLVAPKAPQKGIGIAINDRLKKASAGSKTGEII